MTETAVEIRQRQTEKAKVLRACKDIVPVHDPSGEWRNRAECRGVDASMFYPRERLDGRPKGGRPTVRDTDDMQTARRVCLGCPVRAECLGDALTERERWGIRAGLTAAERRPFAATWEIFVCRRCSIIFHAGPVAHNKVRNFCDACRIEARKETLRQQSMKRATDPYAVGNRQGQQFGEVAS